MKCRFIIPFEKLYFTSDQHHGHINIIKYCNRPFPNVHEMDKAIINNINNIVQEDDYLVMCGDFTMSSNEHLISYYRNRYKCKNIFYVIGDHGVAHDIILQKYFCNISQILEIETRIPETNKRQLVIACHYAMLRWPKSHYASIQTYGHSHGRLQENEYSLQCDVGVDSWNFGPVSMQQIWDKMKTKKFNPIIRGAKENH